MCMELDQSWRHFAYISVFEYYRVCVCVCAHVECIYPTMACGMIWWEIGFRYGSSTRYFLIESTCTCTPILPIHTLRSLHSLLHVFENTPFSVYNVPAAVHFNFFSLHISTLSTLSIRHVAHYLLYQCVPLTAWHTLIYNYNSTDVTENNNN